MPKKLTIVQIAPLEEPVPPHKYGGTELVVYNLTEELIRRGHKVYLISTKDSITSGRLISVMDKGIRHFPHVKNQKIRESLKFVGVGKILEALKGIKADIVHNHLGWRLLPFLDFIGPPVITTLHGPLNQLYQKNIYRLYEKSYYASISLNQRKPLPNLNYVGNVYNGIGIDKFDFSEKKGDYFAFLGRTSPEKGPVQAIEMAKAAKVKLKIAAKIDMVDREFFEKEIKPLIDQKQIEFIGEIDQKKKNEFLKNAIALLAPIQWNEPFGLYFTEAMACGTPVISFRRGSVPEVIKNGETGFVAKMGDVKGMVELVKKMAAMPEEEYIKMRHNCRRHVIDYFTISKMADGYEQAYYRVVKKKK